MRKRLWLYLVVAEICFCFSGVARADIDPATVQKLFSEDAGATWLFGYSVAVSGNTAVVGSPDFSNGGAAYVFTRSCPESTDWTVQQKLNPPDLGFNLNNSGLDDFGLSVAIDKDTILIGSRSWDSSLNPGGITVTYVFTRSEGVWGFQQELSIYPTVIDGKWHGVKNVAVHGDIAVVVVGGLRAVLDYDYGIAYVFVRSAGVWRLQQEIAVAGSEESFGSSVSIDGETIVFGAMLDDDNGEKSGAAYVYTRTGEIWSQQQKILCPDAGGGNLFGSSVSLSADTLLIGASSYNENSSGTAYIFTRFDNEWSLQQSIAYPQLSDPTYYGLFGEGEVVSLDKDTAVIGGGSSAYVFTRSGDVWTQKEQLVPDYGEQGNFGFSVSVDGGNIVIGSEGSVYFYGQGNQCDSDGDSITDDQDNCPLEVNPDQIDTDGDNIGDACDPRPEEQDSDTDADEVYDYIDNCSSISNQDQKDTDKDGLGDVCDSDIDSDGVDNEQDNCPLSANPNQRDRDDDGIGNVCDSDVVCSFNPTEAQRLLAEGGEAMEEFGFSIAIDGDTAVVGAPGDIFAYEQPAVAGSAYIFTRLESEWIFQQRLVAPDGMAEGRFGSSVSISGDTIAVGALDKKPVYIFVRSGNEWVLEQQVSVDDPAVNFFGFTSVVVEGDTLAVTAERYEPPDLLSLVYIFTRSSVVNDQGETVWTWNFEQEIVAYAGSDYNFSWVESMLVLEKNTLVVSLSDGVHVYARSGNTWYPQQKITRPVGEADNAFGLSVSLHEDTIAIGAPCTSYFGSTCSDSDSGVYLFSRLGTAWVYRQKLTPDESSESSFGRSVSVDGDTIVVGAPYAPDEGGEPAGSIYVFAPWCPAPDLETVWIQQQKITVPDNGSEGYWSLGSVGNHR